MAMTIQNFIVPIDFSEDSIKGLEIAILFTQVEYCHIQMVYVQKNTQEYPHGSKTENYRDAESRLEALKEKYKDQLKNDSKLKYIIREGKIFREVVSQAHSYKDSIICASTHGASGFEELFIGSNAFQIITAANRPVITIRKEYVPETIKRIVLPITLLKETRQKVPLTSEIAKYFNATVHVLPMFPYRSDKRSIHRVKSYANQAVEYFENRGIETQMELLTGEKEDVLTVDYAKTINADLIVILSDRHSGLNLVTGSFCHEVINNADRPVLNLPPKSLGKKGTFKTIGGGTG
jgi:nucleotide-binding universal stress UspA family protein